MATLLRCQSYFSCVGNVCECEVEVLKVSSTHSVYLMNSKHPSGGCSFLVFCVAHRGVTSGLGQGWSPGCWPQWASSILFSLCAPSTSTFCFLFLSSLFLSFFPPPHSNFSPCSACFSPSSNKQALNKTSGHRSEKLKLLKYHVYSCIPSEFKIGLIYFIYNFNVCIIKFWVALLSLPHVGISYF